MLSHKQQLFYQFYRWNIVSGFISIPNSVLNLLISLNLWLQSVCTFTFLVGFGPWIKLLKPLCFHNIQHQQVVQLLLGDDDTAAADDTWVDCLWFSYLPAHLLKSYLGFSFAMDGRQSLTEIKDLSIPIDLKIIETIQLLCLCLWCFVESAFVLNYLLLSPSPCSVLQRCWLVLPDLVFFCFIIKNVYGLF